MIALVTSSAAYAQGQAFESSESWLDWVKFGDAESERGHQFEADHSQVIQGAQDSPESLHIASVSATAGSAPESTLTPAGEWGVLRKGEWIDYELSDRTTLDHLKVAWGRTQMFFFEIHTSLDGESWQRVFEGESWRRGSDHFQTYRFDPVQTRFVRIVAKGRQTKTRQGRFFVSQVRIGELPYPQAYEPALSYTPGLGRSCRRLLPVTDQWEGGWLRFVMKCEPRAKTYLTVKFWGSDKITVPLYLRDAKGRWVVSSPQAMRRSGDNAAWTPIWEYAGGVAKGPFPGRFIYVTYPIPREMTRGRTEVTLQLQAVGSSFEHPMKTPCQGIYAAWTHGNPFSGFADDEPRGEPFTWGPNRPAPEGISVEEKLMSDARQLIEKLIAGGGLNTDNYRGLEALTQAYRARWSDHYKDEQIVHLVRETIDDAIRRQHEKGEGPGGIGGWHEHGHLARSFVQVADAFETMGLLQQRFDFADDRGVGGFAYASRRDVYARFFHEAMEWRRSEHGARRRVANQVISVDRAIYRMNRALQLLAPELAMSKKAALRYLYESAGLAPFYSAWPRHEWVRAVTDAGYPYFVVSDKGNTREVGLGTSYGEGAPSRFARLAAEIDDEKMTERARRMARARTTMTRRPANDGAGYAVLQAPVTFGWRGRGVRAYPGEIRYTNAPLIQAAVLQDPVSLRIAELYLAHGRVFAEGTPRVNQIIPRVDAYRQVMKLLPSEHRLPMEPDHPDFAWADEGVAVFAAKHGDTMFTGSFFLDKAGVTPYGRIHYTTPRIERIATFKVDVEFNGADHKYAIEGNLPGDRKSVLAGRQRSAVAPPPNLIEPPGSSPPQSAKGISEAGSHVWMGSDERSSMADQYRVRFGDYLVAMNTTVEGTYREQSFTIPVDSNATEALDLVSGQMIDLSKPVELGPRTTIVLYLGE
ncbi:MAG: discoidin domain-containing protein [Pirellulaceae bacterium]